MRVTRETEKPKEGGKGERGGDAEAERTREEKQQEGTSRRKNEDDNDDDVNNDDDDGENESGRKNQRR